ncbi:MAG: shikimate dehydrogenase [Gammaproteobacteria bacterium]|nr:shikimate dehydrogenase [Gammaproteobacteria bacterium]MBU1414544.1 shikimate dehydrogenase [Gammaproteobacteria bacterium]
MTDRYVVIGNPVAHSQSPRIHALFAAATAQDMAYATLPAPLDGFAATVRDFVAGGGRGANVTVPFKEEAFRIATRLSDRAQAAGAVNTLTFSGNGILGDNTDGAGLVRDLKSNLGTDISGKRVLLLGAGGAARGVILPLLGERPSQLLIANRTADKALALARDFDGCEGCGLEALDGRPFDLIINATSAGLTGGVSPRLTFRYAPDALAYDMIYGRETDFLRQATAAGARTADGLGMLVEQAAEAFLVWRGIRPETAPVLAELRGA